MSEAGISIIAAYIVGFYSHLVLRLVHSYRLQHKSTHTPRIEASVVTAKELEHGHDEEQPDHKGISQ